MIYASGKTTRLILIICLFGFFLLTLYFLNEVKKIEKIYDNITAQSLRD